MEKLQIGIWVILVMDDLWSDRGLLAHASWLNWQSVCEPMSIGMAVIAHRLKKPIRFQKIRYYQSPAWLEQHHFYVDKKVYGRIYRLVEQRVVVMEEGRMVASFRMNERGCQKAIYLAGKLAFSRWKEYLS